MISKPGLTLLEINDNGCGIYNSHKPDSRSGLGMHTMQYRASMLGASLQILAIPSGGTRILINLPVKQETPHAI